MTELVTGATGFVGNAVLVALRERNHAVVGLVRKPNKAKRLETAGARIAVGDMLDCASSRARVGSEGTNTSAGAPSHQARTRSRSPTQ
jgi:uncharacterized protein YbjT (DUF2867 family)